MNDLETEKLTTGWPWRLFIFSFIVFAVVFVGYLGLTFGYKPYLNSQISKKDQEISALAQSVPEAEQQALLKFYSQLSNLQEVLKNHILSSKFFTFLEKNTNQKVFYTNLNLSVSEKRAALDGSAQSFEILSQQLEAFNQAPEVERFLVSQADARGELVNFRILLFLTPEILR